jgi:hypothetical protein
VVTLMSSILAEAHVQTSGALLSLLVVTAGYLIWNAATAGKRRRKGYPLPPGPTGIPVLGNVHQLPATKEHYTWAEWSKVSASRLDDSSSNMLLEVRTVILCHRSRQADHCHQLSSNSCRTARTARTNLLRSAIHELRKRTG